MKINEDFIKGNNRIRIMSNDGNPTRFKDAWIPVLEGCDMLVAIPDMHMYLHSENLDNFKYNSANMLHMLEHLSDLKETMRFQGKVLRIYQMGDMYELRFPGRGGNNATSGEINMSHADFDRIHNTLNDLNTHYIYGNHDFEHRHVPGYQFYANVGKVHLEHGFAADKWADFANPGQPFWEPAQLVFKEIREVERFLHGIAVNLGMVPRDKHLAAGVLDGSVERGDFPNPMDYRVNHYNQYKHYSDRLVNGSDNETADNDIRICIIAHTHVPYLDIDISGGDYILADAGAWTEGRSDFAVVTDEEMAICRYARA